MDELEAARLIRDWAERYARKMGWILNPDAKQLDAVIRGLARKLTRHGERYCPCRIMTKIRISMRRSSAPASTT